MSGANLTFRDYLKAAFNWKTALPFLGGMPLNKLMLAGFAILGFGNPGFWLLGIALEAGYLMWLASNPRFQKIIQGLKLNEIKEASSQIEKDVLNRLDNESRVRYFRLVDHCQTIVQAEEVASMGAGLANLKSEGLNQLLLIFLKLLSLRRRIKDTLANTRKDEIETDISRLKEKIAKEPETSPVHRALQGTVEIQQQRLDNLLKSEQNLKFTETELERIEKQVSLIAEEAAVNKTPEHWSMTLDGVVKSFQGTSQWMTENPALFEAMETPSEQVDLIRVRRKGVTQ